MDKGIYKLTNTVSGKVYIGQSENLNNREWCHFYRLKRGEHHNEILQHSYNKHGESSFVFEILEHTENLDNRESYWLNEYGGVSSKDTYNMKDPLTNEYCDYTKKKIRKKFLGVDNPNYGNRWSEEQKENLSKKIRGLSWEERLGKEKARKAKKKLSKSQKGRKHSDETKEKIRQHNVGEKNPAYGKGDRQRGEKNPMWGKTHTQEVREKLSNLHKGKILSEETRKKMSESAKKRKSQKGRKHSDETKEKIRQHNVGEKNPAYGKGDRQRGEKNPAYGKPSHKRKPIVKLNKNGEIIKEYEFLSQVKEDGYNPSNVMYCANKKSKYSYGFIWEWKN